MKNKALIFSILILLMAISCSGQVKSNPPSVILFGSPTFVSKPSLTQSPNPDKSGVFTATSTPNQSINPPINGLIAYSAQMGIDVISAGGGTPTPIIERKGAALYLSPFWSPDGKRLVFVSNDEYGYKTYIIDRDGSSLHSFMDIESSNPVWSPDGEYIAYKTGADLYVATSKGSASHHLAKISGLEFPAWSPDGKKLAFLGDSSAFEGPYKIFLLDSDGENLHSITESIAGISRLGWSPDGSKIAFRSYAACGDVNTLDLKTGTITNLTNTPSVGEMDPAWSPDGNYIVFSRTSHTPCEQDKVQSYFGDNLFIMRSNGLDVRQLTFGQASFEPSWWPIVILQPNWKYSVTQAGSNLNIRETATTSAKSLTKLPQRAIFTALNGPQEADGYSWWYIRTDNGIEGWIVDVPGWYMFESAPTSNP